MAGLLTALPERNGEHGENTFAFELKTPIDPTQLDRQIGVLFGEDAPGLTVDGTIAEASEEAPVVLWVHHEAVQETHLEGLLADHDPTPAPDDDLTSISDLLESKEDFTPQQMTKALRLLLQRELAGRPSDGA